MFIPEQTLKRPVGPVRKYLRHFLTGPTDSISFMRSFFLRISYGAFPVKVPWGHWNYKNPPIRLDFRSDRRPLNKKEVGRTLPYPFNEIVRPSH